MRSITASAPSLRRGVIALFLPLTYFLPLNEEEKQARPLQWGALWQAPGRILSYYTGWDLSHELPCLRLTSEEQPYAPPSPSPSETTLPFPGAAEVRPGESHNFIVNWRTGQVLLITVVVHHI